MHYFFSIFSYSLTSQGCMQSFRKIFNIANLLDLNAKMFHIKVHIVLMTPRKSLSPVPIMNMKHNNDLSRHRLITIINKYVQYSLAKFSPFFLPGMFQFLHILGHWMSTAHEFIPLTFYWVQI